MASPTPVPPMCSALPAPPPAVGAKKPKRKYKRRPATVARREIRHAQKATHRVVPGKAMDRLIREIAASVGPPSGLRFGADAVKALHESAEAYIIEIMAGASANAAENHRVTIQDADLKVGVKFVS